METSQNDLVKELTNNDKYMTDLNDAFNKMITFWESLSDFRFKCSTEDKNIIKNLCVNFEKELIIQEMLGYAYDSILNDDMQLEAIEDSYKRDLCHVYDRCLNEKKENE